MNEFSNAVVVGIATFPQRANILEDCSGADSATG